MARDPEEDIRRINSLRQRVKEAENAAAGARVHHQQAQEDLESARKAATGLGIDPDNLEAFDAWLAKEANAIEALIHKAETNLAKAQEAVA